jgi:ribosome biogenesis GTPase
LFVVAALDPPAKAGLVDRAAVAARSASITPVLVINKADLPDPHHVLADLRARVEGELAVVPVSAQSGLGLDVLLDMLANKRGALVGPSGVGKSSIKNRLVPGLELETRALSDTRGAGMHTTTSSTLHTLPNGGELVDTPGVREFGLVDVLPADLAAFFPGFAAVTDACRFRDCMHQEEPGCAVKNAVAAGVVKEPRYIAYRNLLAELQE